MKNKQKNQRNFKEVDLSAIRDRLVELRLHVAAGAHEHIHATREGQFLIGSIKRDWQVEIQSIQNGTRTLSGQYKVRVKIGIPAAHSDFGFVSVFYVKSLEEGWDRASEVIGTIALGVFPITHPDKPFSAGEDNPAGQDDSAPAAVANT